MDANGTRPIVLVLDPDLSMEARRRLVRKVQWFHRDIPAGTGCLGTAAGVTWVTVTFILHFAIGLPWMWIGGVLILALAFYGSYRVAEDYEPRAADWRQVVESSDLDESSRVLLGRAQRAINSALSSEVYADVKGRAVGETVLRRHEWDIATALRDLTNLRGEHTRSKRGAPGPMTVNVLKSQERALTLARDATTSRIRALERYAAQLQAADAAKCDWLRALKISAANDRYLDLVVRTAADEHAIAEINSLTEQASIAQQAFQDSLQEVALAAEALTLPSDRILPTR